MPATRRENKKLFYTLFVFLLNNDTKRASFFNAFKHKMRPDTKMPKILLFIYNFIFILLLIPASLVILIFSNKYRKELFFKLPERFAFWKPFNKTKKTVWIHCSSLGEVRAVEPIIDKLKDDYAIVLTAITKTGRIYAEKIKKTDYVSLLPLDLYPLMNKVFKTIKPDLFILVETELWASLLYAAEKNKVQVMTVNGRMSSGTFSAYKKMKFFWEPFVSLIGVILARSDEDAERFAHLSSGKPAVFVTGNIKYDRDFSANAKRENFGFDSKNIIFTAGSTRDGEEQIIVDAYNELRAKHPDIAVFLAPRHIAKIAKVKEILKKNKVNYSLFSSHKDGEKFESNFILVDVFGKLQSIYSISDICFVGGSIVNKGGQNPIEPAAYGKPVLFGMHMDNFKSESETLVKYNGGIKVFDAKDIADKVNMMLSQKDLLLKTGQNALKAVESQKGAVEMTVQKIKEKING